MQKNNRNERDFMKIEIRCLLGRTGLHSSYKSELPQQKSESECAAGGMNKEMKVTLLP